MNNKIGELADYISIITAIEVTIREIHNLPWVTMVHEDNTVWWKDLNHKSEPNPRTTLSPKLLIRDIQQMSIADLANRIISIFNDIDNWKEAISEYYAVDDIVQAYDRLPRWISEIGDNVNEHISFYEPVACVGDVEMKMGGKEITAMDVIIRKGGVYSIHNKKDVEWYGMDKLTVV